MQSVELLLSILASIVSIASAFVSFGARKEVQNMKKEKQSRNTQTIQGDGANVIGTGNNTTVNAHVKQ